ncbi:MAG: hypothetical protein NTY08_01080 [Proteobacteria bacterium]|nr:hypothetical protein [Pseudomonadota bacterium]
MKLVDKSRVYSLIAALLGFAILTLSACSGGDTTGTSAGTAEGQLGSTSYVVVDAGDLQRTATQVKGSGSIAFKDPIGEIGARKSYQLNVALDDSGSLKLAVNTDETLKNGVEVTLSRAGSALAAKLSFGGASAAAKTLAGIDAAAAINLTIDIHNDENPAHILIWSGSDFTPVKALLDSDRDGATPGQGRGNYWGLVLTKATVTSAVLAAPKFTEQ